MPTTFTDPPRPFAPLRVIGDIEIDGFDQRARLTPGALGTILNVSAGTTSVNLGSITFANSNGISFGIDTNSVITASAASAALSAINISAGTTSQNLTHFAFSNVTGGAGVSFGLSGSTITAVAPTQGHEFQITISGATAWTDLDLAAACPGIQSGDIVSILFSSGGDLTINSIIPPHSAFWCWIGIRATSGFSSKLIIKDTLNAGGLGTAANRFRTPGSSYGDPNPPDFVIASEEGWTAIGYTQISTIWRIMQPTSGLGLSLGTVTGPQNVYTGLSFSNANKVSFGITGVTLTASVASSLTNINISAGAASANLSAVTFSNSNGVSFGLNGSVLTGSVATSLTNFKISAGTSSANLSAVTLSNSNGVSFGLNGSVLTGSVATSLTAVNLSAGTTSNNLSAFTLSNSNNVTFGLNGSVITASASVASSLSNINVSAGTTSQNLSAVTFSNSNGVSFGLNGSVVTGSVATSLTAVNVSAGTTSNNLSALTFSNQNGVSFGLNGSVVTASVAAAALSAVNLSAGTTSNNLTAFTLSNSNNVSFGLNGSVVTASATVASTQGLITVSGGAASVALSNLVFTDANNVSWGLATAAGGGTIQALAAITVSAGTKSNLLSALTLSNSNGVSFGLNGSTITASVATSLTNINVSAGTTSNNLSAVTFSNANGISFGLNGSVVTASHATSLTNINVSAGTTSNNLSALTFSNLNGVSFGLNGSVVTASVAAAALTAINLSAGTTSNNLTAFTVSNANGVSFGLNGSTLTASVATSLTAVNVSAGTTSQNLSAVTFSNLNGVSFGLNGSVITASQSTLSYSNANNVTFGIAGSTLTASVTVASTQGLITASAGGSSVALSNIVFTNTNNVGWAISTAAGGGTVRAAASFNLSAGTSSVAASGITFSNSNGVSFGLNGSVVTADTPQLAIADVFGNTVTNGTLQWSGGFTNRSSQFSSLGIYPNVLGGISNSTITARALMVIETTTGGVGQPWQKLNLLASNGVTFGTFTTQSVAGAQEMCVTASVNAGGGITATAGFDNGINRNASAPSLSLLSNRPFFFNPFPRGIPYDAMHSVSSMGFWFFALFGSINSASTTNSANTVLGACGSWAITARIGLYSGATAGVGTYTLINSCSFATSEASGVSATNGCNYRYITLDPTAWSNSSTFYRAGIYAAVQISMAATNDPRFQLAGENMGFGTLFGGYLGSTNGIGTGRDIDNMHGVWTAATAALPTNIQPGNIAATVSAYAPFTPFMSVMAGIEIKPGA